MLRPRDSPSATAHGLYGLSTVGTAGMRRWCRQDPKTRTSGQVAVAVITGQPVEEVIKRVGHSHHASTRELARVLGHYGFLCPDRCVPVRDARDLPKLALAQVHSSRQPGSHWVAGLLSRMAASLMESGAILMAWSSGRTIFASLPTSLLRTKVDSHSSMVKLLYASI